jgi:elongation factor G
MKILRGLKAVVMRCTFVPVFVAAGQPGRWRHPPAGCDVSILPSPAEVAPAMATGKCGEEQSRPADSGPLAAYVWKTTADPFVGKQTFFRVYSGTITVTRAFGTPKRT